MSSVIVGAWPAWRATSTDRVARVIVDRWVVGVAADLPAVSQSIGAHPFDRLGLAHEAAQAVDRFDQALVAQQHDRFTSRPARHTVLGSQLVLAGHLLTRPNTPVAIAERSRSAICR